jgi:cation:H+ antiporter
LLVASAVLLTAGSELFAKHASAAGRRFGVTVLAIGPVLAGAEPEEMVTAIFASARHLPGIAAGDAVGANVTMLTVVLGLAARARPLELGGRVRTYSLASAAGVTAALALLGGQVGRAWGVLLVVAYLLAVGVVWWRERRPPAFGEAAELPLGLRQDRVPQVAGEPGSTRSMVMIRSIDRSNEATLLMPVVSALATR